LGATCPAGEPRSFEWRGRASASNALAWNASPRPSRTRPCEFRALSGRGTRAGRGTIGASVLRSSEPEPAATVEGGPCRRRHRSWRARPPNFHVDGVHPFPIADALTPLVTAGYGSLVTDGSIAMDRTNAERQRRYIARLKERAAQGSTAAVTNDPDEAPERRELTSAEQDQILNLVLRLLKTVDHQHEKKFHEYYVSNTHRGVLLPSCSHRGWKGGGCQIDISLLTRLWAAIKRNSCRLPDSAVDPH
jgi:hypothetical protein